MNLAQWIAVAVPVLAVYLLFVFKAETKGKVDRRENVWTGLIIVPFIFAMIPAAAIGLLAEMVRKRGRGIDGAIVGFGVLLVYALLAWLVYALRTVPVSIEDLKVE